MFGRKSLKNKFLEKFDAIWEEGPTVQYLRPDSWRQSNSNG
jgi:hypothetical protein